jgi:polyhydroxybutyrate depolymerase
MTEAECLPSTEPVSVLQIHGTNDATISYDGGNLGQGQVELNYPSAEESVELHASLNGCDSTPVEAAAPLDIEVSIPGEESSALRYEDGCADGTVVELWTIDGGGHIPTLSPSGTRQILEWLLQRSR